MKISNDFFPIVWIPYRESDQYRRRNYEAVVDQVRETELPYVVADAPGDVFSLARTWNLCAEISRESHPSFTHAILWTADAILVDLESLWETCEMAIEGHHFIHAFERGWRMKEDESKTFLAGGVLPDREPTHVYGGLTMVSREAFEGVNGYDPNFTGHGAEDFAFNHVVRNLYGTLMRAHGLCVNLWHPTMWGGGDKTDPYWTSRERNYERWAKVEQLTTEFELRQYVNGWVV